MSADGKAAQDIRNALTDARALCEQLGLAPAHAKKQRSGYIVRCPAHGETNPSCSVSLGPDGTVRVKCFSCQYGGDALSLIASVHHLELRGPRFKEVLILGAELAGLHDLLDSLRRDTDYKPSARPPPPRRAEPEDEVDYPNAGEVAALWTACAPVTGDLSVAELLTSRALSPDVVRMLDLARALPASVRLPRWASYQGQTWTQTGHRLILPVYDYEGAQRSVRAWRVVPNDTPKRLPPGGHKAAELVLANKPALEWLRHSDALPYGPPPMRLVVVEGEPDFLVRATLNAGQPVVGLLSGAWHVGYAVKIPTGSEVFVYTHRDRAGDKYADEVSRSIRNDGIQVHRISPTATTTT
jgi:hypothetical protein